MARIRTIKPEFWTDEKIVELAFEVRLLYIGLWNFSDDLGRMVNSPSKIKMQIFPADDFKKSDVQGMITELFNKKIIDCYAVDNKHYIQIINWNHQKINRPTPSLIPEKEAEQGTLFSESSSTERKGKERKVIKKVIKKVFDGVVPDDWVDWAINGGLSRKSAEIEKSSFIDYWYLGEKKTVKREDWFLTWKPWIRKHRDFAGEPVLNGNAILSDKPVDEVLLKWQPFMDIWKKDGKWLACTGSPPPDNEFTNVPKRILKIYGVIK